MIKLPGLIDPHVHARGLSTDSYKENFFTVTSAALAGGFTTILDMPNNPKTPTLTYDLLLAKQKIAKDKIVCDMGFFFGTNGKNLEEFKIGTTGTLGLKVFLSFSTANLIIDFPTFQQVLESWPKDLIIMLHAEEKSIEKALEMTHHSGHKVHVCHVSCELELTQVIKAKEKGFKVTCGVTPHHLFLTEEDSKKLGSFGLMKPSLKKKSDVDFLWNHISEIDLVESDHAPHSKEEKLSENPPFGVTGLETTLSLLLTAVNNNKLELKDIERLCYKGASKIFNITDDENTYIEVDENEKWIVDENKLFTKAKSSPFNGWELTGRVKNVFLRGEKVFGNNQILAKMGSGKIIKSLV